MARFQRPGEQASSAFGISFATDRDAAGFGEGIFEAETISSQV